MGNILAVIDVGTLKVKFEVRDYSVNPEGTVIFKDKRLTVLGRDLDKNDNLISEKSLELVIETLKDIRLKMNKLNVGRYKAVTTEAIRRAKNSALALGRIKESTGIDLEVISHEDEARILFHTIAKDFSGQTIAVADIGGGSVQLIIGQDEKIFETHLFKTGTYFMQEKFSKTHHPTFQDLKNAKQYIKGQLVSLKRSKTKPALLVYGTTNIIDFMRAMNIRLQKSNADTAHKLYTNIIDLGPVYDKIIQYSYEERMPMYPEEPYYMWAADKALMNVFQICDYLQIKMVYPSNSNISSGLFYKLKNFSD